MTTRLDPVPPATPPPVPAVPPSGARASAPPGAARRLLGDWRVRFAALSLIWGFSFVFIKVGTEAFAPLQVGLGRVLCGAAVLGSVAVARRERLPRDRRTLAHLAVSAVLLNTVPFALFGYAEQRIPSTLAGICNATTPLFSMALTLVALSEDRPTRQRAAGLGIGFAGVLTVLGAWQGFSGEDPAGTALALLASFSYAVGWVHLRRFLSGTPHSGLALTTGQLLMGSWQLAALAVAFTGVPDGLPVRPVLAVAALGALGTGAAYLMQFQLVKEVGPTVATMVTYALPVVAAVAGVLLLHERLTWNEPVGAVVVLVGAAIARGGPRTGQP